MWAQDKETSCECQGFTSPGLNRVLGTQHRKKGTGNVRDISRVEAARLSNLLSKGAQGQEGGLVKFQMRQLTYYHSLHFWKIGGRKNLV